MALLICPSGEILICSISTPTAQCWTTTPLGINENPWGSLKLIHTFCTELSPHLSTLSLKFSHAVCYALCFKTNYQIWCWQVWADADWGAGSLAWRWHSGKNSETCSCSLDNTIPQLHPLHLRRRWTLCGHWGFHHVLQTTWPPALGNPQSRKAVSWWSHSCLRSASVLCRKLK